MVQSIFDLPLLQRLQSLDAPHLLGRIADLRSQVEDWLSYIPHTFPHYTRHTVKHSDEIIKQLSLVLFDDDNSVQPRVRMTSYEIYVLVIAAYLHDAGMVASDAEKHQILMSEPWREWTTTGAGGSRWAEIEQLRNKESTDTCDMQFLADVQTRYLLAEFIRKRHHIRAANVVTAYAPLIGGYANGNAILARTISDICIGHGISWRELEDRERYPLRRDIESEPVNVRFITMLLRLGDLLDLSSDRACPLLLNAASPVPADSYAHWTQYARIIHRATSPDAIELIAECENQDEHRLLQDWCAWIGDELARVPNLLMGDPRHGRWSPPAGRLQERPDDPRATIIVRPSPNAAYLPVRWAFELDPDIVVQRLIANLHTDPLTFVRELLQNAFDASRCSLARHMKAAGSQPPEWPSDAPDETRAQWPVAINLYDSELQDAISGETESYQVLSIEDSGIGMTAEVIQRYLLQVGRSFYTSPEFRRGYNFVPTSRFGIGFLSVFSVSDRITIDTLCELPGSEAIRVTLTGPRNYLVVERSARSRPGTTITLQLRDRISPEHLGNRVAEWCRRVEFPIILEFQSTRKSVVPEKPAQFEKEHRVHEEFRETVGQFLRVRGIPIVGRTVRGELYVFEHEAIDGSVRWDRWSLDTRAYTDLHPTANIPREPEGRVFFNGMSTVRSSSSSGLHLRADIRMNQADLPLDLARTPERYADLSSTDEIDALLTELVLTHLRAAGPVDYGYQRRITNSLTLPVRIWENWPIIETLRADGTPQRITFKDLQGINSLAVIWAADSYVPEASSVLLGRSTNVDVIIQARVLQELEHNAFYNVHSRWGIVDIPVLSEHFQVHQFDAYRPKQRWLSGQYVIVPRGVLSDSTLAQYLPNFGVGLGDLVALNAANPVVLWLAAIFGITELSGVGETKQDILKETPVDSFELAIGRIIESFEHSRSGDSFTDVIANRISNFVGVLGANAGKIGTPSISYRDGKIFGTLNSH